ncbi:MAG: hypothetical protein K9K81_02235 [Desulfobacteraceae bacterium]|nr:hypothetical protein [Desulfobacteraceae bacterium]
MALKDFQKNFVDRVSGKMHCIECGRKAGIHDNNYAMLNILEKVNYAFPGRIDAPIVPGNQNSFLCEECINSSDFKITCSTPLISMTRFITNGSGN